MKVWRNAPRRLSHQRNGSWKVGRNGDTDFIAIGDELLTPSLRRKLEGSRDDRVAARRWLQTELRIFP